MILGGREDELVWWEAVSRGMRCFEDTLKVNLSVPEQQWCCQYV